MKSRAVHRNIFALAPFSCEFRDASLEQSFQFHHLAQNQAQLRTTLSACALFYLAFAATDLARLGYGSAALQLLLARLAVAALAAASLLLIRLRPRSVGATRLAASAAEAFALLIFLFIVLKRPGEMQWHAMSMSIALIVIYIYIPNRLLYASALALPATLAFIVLAAHTGALHSSDMLTMSMLLLLSNLFGGVAARRYQRLWREEYRAQSILRNLSVRDPLTDCFNRRHLHEQLLEHEIARARRHALCLTVIMCDLDNFKDINDTYGHFGGDAVLRAFAALLRSMTREGIDSVVRFGGEEFLLILPETDLDGGAMLAERLRRSFAAAVVPHEEKHISGITASFGVASVDLAGTGKVISQYAIIASADELLYAAKKGGRNLVRSVQLT